MGPGKHQAWTLFGTLRSNIWKAGSVSWLHHPPISFNFFVADEEMPLKFLTYMEQTRMGLCVSPSQWLETSNMSQNLEPKHKKNLWAYKKNQEA